MRGIFYDVYFSLSFTDHSQQGVVGENDVESGGIKNADLVFAASTQSTPHPTLTCRPLPQGARLKNAMILNAKGGDKSTPPIL